MLCLLKTDSLGWNYIIVCIWLCLTICIVHFRIHLTDTLKILCFASHDGYFQCKRNINNSSIRISIIWIEANRYIIELILKGFIETVTIHRGFHIRCYIFWFYSFGFALMIAYIILKYKVEYICMAAFHLYY